MGSYLARRLIGVIPVLFIITLVTFLSTALIRGDAASVLLGPTATPERVEEGREPIEVLQAGQLIRGDPGGGRFRHRRALSS